MIVGVENKPNKTFIELAHFPLNHYGKPSTNGETSGRFKVQIDGFVDPIVFEEGRAATFLGTVTAPTAGMVGEQPYIYPTIIADDYHMWRKQEVYDVNTYFFNYHTGWYSPFYRFNGPWMYPHFNRTRVIRYENAPSKATLPSKSSRTKSNMKPTIQPAKINKEK
jgi:outer membrane lipoprotein